MVDPLARLETRCLIRPADLPASRDDFEVVGAFNPGAVQLDDGSVVLLVRVAERPRATRDGWVASPRYSPEGEIVTDWIDEERVTRNDPRMVIFKDTGFKRLTFINHLRVVRLAADGVSIAALGPIVDFSADHATFGLEDPRITRLDGKFYITAASASPHGVCTVLLSTSDFHAFEDHGIIFCRENKDVVLFPEKIGGHYAAIHRPTGKFEVTQPEMWFAESPDLKYWGGHRPLWGSGLASGSNLTGTGGGSSGGWDDGRVGGGVPPIRTQGGWLVIYHASCRPGPGEPIGVYAAGALLLDLEDPCRVLAASPDAFMRPEKDFEKLGFVKAVVFPTGYARLGDDLLLYYGAADTNVGVVRYRIDDLLESLTTITR